MNTLREKLKESVSRQDLNEENILDKIKDKLLEKDVDTYREWKNNNFNLNHIFYGKFTLLHFAAEHGVVYLAKYLIQNGADVNAIDYIKNTPLYHAAKYGNIKIMEFFIENGANVNAVGCFESPLHAVIKDVSEVLRTSVLKLLIENGACIEALDEIGQSPLHAAAKANHGTDVVRFLLENGAMIDALDNAKNTPLHHAVYFNKFEAVKVLVEYGASINVFNQSGETPFLLAVAKSDLQIAKYLLEMGADANPDFSDTSPYYMVITGW